MWTRNTSLFLIFPNWLHSSHSLSELLHIEAQFKEGKTVCSEAEECFVDLLQNMVSALEGKEEAFCVYASVCAFNPLSKVSRLTLQQFVRIFTNNCQRCELFLYLVTVLEGKFYKFHRLDLSCQHHLLPVISELYKHGRETAASASLHLVVAHSDYIIHTEEMKNPVAFDCFLIILKQTKGKRSKQDQFYTCEKQKNPKQWDWFEGLLLMLVLFTFEVEKSYTCRIYGCSTSFLQFFTWTGSSKENRDSNKIWEVF